MKEVERALKLGRLPEGELRRKIIATLRDRLAPRLVWSLERAHREGATVSEKLHWLRLARGHICAALEHPYILITTDVLHILLQMINNMVVAWRAVAESAPEVELSGELSTASVLEALGELDGGGPTRGFAAGVKAVCENEGAPGVYGRAVRTVMATVPHVRTHPRVLATPKLPGIVLWLLAVVLRKIRPGVLKSVKTARALRDAAQGLVLLHHGRPDGSPEPAGGAKRARSGDDTDDDGDGSPEPARGKMACDAAQGLVLLAASSKPARSKRALNDKSDAEGEGSPEPAGDAKRARDGSPQPARSKREGSPQRAGDAKRARDAQ